jgi:trans-2,3-dihydro-3-hydroxyanthranilate isomerase
VVVVTLRRDAAGRAIGATIAAPQPLKLGGEVAVPLAAACASLPPEAAPTARHAPRIASDGGNPRLLLEVTPEGLAAAAPDLAGFRAAVAALPELGGKLSLYLYRRDGAAIRARMFSPSPHAGGCRHWQRRHPLAGFLHGLTGEGAFTIHQGVEMAPAQPAAGARLARGGWHPRQRGRRLRAGDAGRDPVRLNRAFSRGVLVCPPEP